jgi:hypothetical protein
MRVTHKWVAVVGLVVGLAGCTNANAADVGTQTDQPSVEPTVEVVSTSAVATNTPEPSATATIMLTATVMLTATPDTPADRITDVHGVEMVLIPEGEFTMGSEAGFPDEVPVHQVWVDAFYIDLTEVTNGQYRACVDAGVCEAPRRVECCPDRTGSIGRVWMRECVKRRDGWNAARMYRGQGLILRIILLILTMISIRWFILAGTMRKPSAHGAAGDWRLRRSGKRHHAGRMHGRTPGGMMSRHRSILTLCGL